MKEKKTFRSLCTLALVLLTALGAAAQELRCNVIVNSNQIQETGQIADKQIFRDLQQSNADFMNTRRWTEDKFSANERINCNLVITITKVPAINSFEANVQVQSSRPVYGTDYESILLNYVDRNCAFQYTAGQPMDFNENIVTSALTTLWAFTLTSSLALTTIRSVDWVATRICSGPTTLPRPPGRTLMPARAGGPRMTTATGTGSSKT